MAKLILSPQRVTLNHCSELITANRLVFMLLFVIAEFSANAFSHVVFRSLQTGLRDSYSSCVI